MITKKRTLAPAQIILATMCATILVGTFLLALPLARTQAVSFLDLLFSATSATCVTGLFTIPLDQFTFFGQLVLLVLIQIGGLGLITLTLMFASLFVDLGLATQVLASNVMELENWRNVKRLLIFIMLTTFICEALGALCIYMVLPAGTSESLFQSIFHAISSFCNAGILLPSMDMAVYTTSYVILLATMALICIGGLGFITWYEIGEYIRAYFKNERFRFSLHSKIILYGSTALLIGSMVIFWILERDNVLSQASIPYMFVNTLFQAISFKSTGLSTVPLGEMQLATLFIIMIISLIGSSPASTGSGIKITTFAIFLATVKAAISGKTSVDIKGRSIPKDQIFRVIAIVAVALGWIALSTFCLLVSERNWQFFDLFFEAWNAFTTLGMSTGVTPSLSPTGKVIIIMSMIMGRIGSFSLIMALKVVRRTDTTGFSYPEERVMIG